ncbi:MAG: carboxylating nicotinate-nucleotide diphosphorylase [Acidobacteria bacterium]|nr:carboxylating nicotinate-nucleotide diphosphorylase [Acidobacteriota bacterium]
MKAEIQRFLQEDIGREDLTTACSLPSSAMAKGHIVAREACVLAGAEVARRVFLELDPSLHCVLQAADGHQLSRGQSLLSMTGRAAPILTGERLALNLLQRLCGIATLTRRYVEAVSGTAAQIVDTRKTTPGLRQLEKYAVRMGGGANHRLRLDDGILIKDNHIAIAGGIESALKRVRAAGPLPIQVEVDNLSQLRVALDFGVEAVLLDNMTPEQTAEAVRLIRSHACGMHCFIEASGGITLENVRCYAESGVDIISVGALTHSAAAADLSLELETLGPAQQ